MKEEGMMAEIEQLKQQLASLAAARQQAPAQDAAEGTEDQRQSPGAEGETGHWFRDVLKHAEELMEGLDLQFKDVPARSALVIFTLGVLTGRLLSRRG